MCRLYDNQKMGYYLPPKRNDQSTQEKTQRDLTCKRLNQRHDSKKNETVKNR